MLRITWPAVLPIWIASLRSGLGLGFMFVVAAELMGASEGLGYLLLDGQQMGRADTILVAMIVFALLGKAVGRRAGRAERAAAALAGHGAEPAVTTLAIERARQDLRRRHRGAARHAHAWRTAARSSPCSAARAAARRRCCA